MSIVHSIRKWLRESPHSPTPQEPTCGIEAPPPRRKPILEITAQHTEMVTTIRYSDARWADLPPEAARASACILQSEILAAYKAFLSYSEGAAPYLHVSDVVIRFSDITALRVQVVSEKLT